MVHGNENEDQNSNANHQNNENDTIEVAPAENNLKKLSGIW